MKTLRSSLGLLAALVALSAALALSAASPAGATVWLCRPGLASNPCNPGLSTTGVSPAGKSLGAEPVTAAKRPPVDCFYVYPTVSDQKSTQADLTIDPVQRSIALYQAARYSSVCRIYAPMYRQFTLQGLKQFRVDGTTALADVRAAFRDYLKTYNKGRGIILIGHSQGTFMLRRLLATDIDPKPAMRRKLISAILLGGNVEVETGKDVGGDFKHVSACRSSKQIGCVIAYSTFDTPVVPHSNFGVTSTPGRSVLCTNPAALGGGSGTLDTIFPSAPFAPQSTLSVGIALLGAPLPTAPTSWVHVAGAYKAQCSSANGAHVLQITPQGGAPTFKPSPDATWGLHLVDANIALGNLLGVVGEQSARWAAKNPSRGA